MLYLWQQGQIVFMLAEQPVAVQARDTVRTGFIRADKNAGLWHHAG
jgi:hypothetical protein